MLDHPVLKCSNVVRKDIGDASNLVGFDGLGWYSQGLGFVVHGHIYIYIYIYISLKESGGARWNYTLVWFIYTKNANFPHTMGTRG